MACLVAMALWAHGGWPPASGAGLWFYSAAIAVLLSVFVSEPFYTSPKTALTNSAALFLVVLTADTGELQAADHVVSVGRVILLVVSGLVFAGAIAAITTESRSERLNSIAFPVAVTFGAGYFLYGLTYTASAYGAFAHSPARLAVLLTGALAFEWAPFERLVVIGGRFRSSTPAQFVVVREVEDPSTAIATGPSDALHVGKRLREPGGAIGVVVDVSSTADTQWTRVAFPSDALLRVDARLEATGEADDSVIGYVAAGSVINSIKVTTSTHAAEVDVEEGQLLAADVRGRPVLFQITGAALQEDRLGSQARVRFRVEAQKLGAWNDEEHTFDLIPWLPSPGAPAVLQTRHAADFDPDGIGFVPGSRYSIRYKPTAAVTHNTAILGILGSGKTTLARELICRNIDAGVKVLVLDITNQYGRFFDHLVPAVEEAARTAAINAATQPLNFVKSPDADGVSFGSRGELIRQLDADVTNFIAGDDQLRIYNPMAVNATTIDGTFRQGNNAQSLREMSVVEKPLTWHTLY